MDSFVARRVPPMPSPTVGYNPFEIPSAMPARMNEAIFGNRKVRPSHFQKAVKSYDGSGDPHNHLTSVRQFARAENVRDFHTLIEGFGLTLEGKALHWFQTLDPTSFQTIEQLERQFTATFSKTGMKHDELS